MPFVGSWLQPIVSTTNAAIDVAGRCFMLLLTLSILARFEPSQIAETATTAASCSGRRNQPSLTALLVWLNANFRSTYLSRLHNTRRPGNLGG